jgi:hypothetical protein
MKGRTALLILAVLLCLGAVADAAAPAPAVADAPAACGASMSTLQPAGLGLAPPVIFLTATCGPCSLSPCQGLPIRTGCYLGPNQGWGSCQNVYGTFCSGQSGQPLQSQCQCWKGPLP